MTDKLPEWLEKWIAHNENAYEARDKYGDLHGVNVAIDVDDLRAFLAKFVLCSPEVAAYQHADFTGERMLTDAKLSITEDYKRLGLPMIPLHAPATKEPKQ